MEILKLLKLQWDRTLAVVAAFAAGLAMLLGYIGVSGTPHVAEQLPYFISGGFFGIFLLGIAIAAWLTADLRDEWRELRAVRRLLEEDMKRADSPSYADASSTTTTSSDSWIQ